MIYELVITPWLVALLIWELVWKSLGLWKSARKNQSAWFICILIFNTMGILPILYIYVFQKKKKKVKVEKIIIEKPLAKKVSKKSKAKK